MSERKLMDWNFGKVDFFIKHFFWVVLFSSWKKRVENKNWLLRSYFELLGTLEYLYSGIYSSSSLSAYFFALKIVGFLNFKNGIFRRDTWNCYCTLLTTLQRRTESAFSSARDRDCRQTLVLLLPSGNPPRRNKSFWALEFVENGTWQSSVPELRICSKSRFVEIALFAILKALLSGGTEPTVRSL